MYDFSDLAHEIRKILKLKPDLKSDLIDLYEIAVDEIQDGESEQEEVEKALKSINDLLEEKNGKAN